MRIFISICMLKYHQWGSSQCFYLPQKGEEEVCKTKICAAIQVPCEFCRCWMLVWTDLHLWTPFSPEWFQWFAQSWLSKLSISRWDIDIRITPVHLHFAIPTLCGFLKNSISSEFYLQDVWKFKKLVSPQVIHWQDGNQRKIIPTHFFLTPFCWHKCSMRQVQAILGLLGWPRSQSSLSWPVESLSVKNACNLILSPAAALRG